MSFFQNTCKPKGIGGKIMVNMMNIGHSSMAEWGFTHIEIRNNYICLDIGCGGGANVKKLLAKTPYGKVTGIDYSEISVIKSQKINKAEIENKRCEILQGNVMKLPFGNETFDEDKATGRTVRKTPAQKALRFKIYAAAVFALIFLISVIVIF